MDHLSEETLFELARGKLSGARLETAMGHVAACADCAALLAHAAPALEGAGGGGLASGTRWRGSDEDTAAARPVRVLAPSALWVGAVVRGTYRVVRLIGRGGMGMVYEVTHARLAGRYALKVMNPEFAADEAALSRFRLEAQVTSGLRHPNIVQVIDFDQTEDGHHFLAMEFLDGPTLARHLEQQGRLPMASVVAIVRQVADALEAAHRAGVVHRDLKPENVVLVPQEEGRFLVKLLDFGLSKMRTGAQRITNSTAILGTPAYMTPEQAAGAVDKVDARTDQYALAALVWEMLVGRPPFRADSVHALLHQIVYEPPPAAEGMASGVERVLRRALSKEQDQRYSSVAAFAEALARAADEQSSMPPVVTAARQRPLGSRRFIAFGVVVGVAAGAMAIYSGNRRGVRVAPAPAFSPPPAQPPARPAATGPDAQMVVAPPPPEPPPAPQPRPSAPSRLKRARPAPAPVVAPTPEAPAPVPAPDPAPAPPDAAPPAAPPDRERFPKPLKTL